MTRTAPFGGSLAEWLDWQLALHSREIDLGLERIRIVARRLGVLPFSARSVVIAGTNGKGSCARLLESFLNGQGRCVGTFTSPHLWRYNERIRVNSVDVPDADLCTVFTAVETARRDVSLTFFEYGTLAALWLFKRAAVDFAVLEVGLGGRLDAVNIVDAEVALITNVGLDHTDFLGDTREAIGAEKAGILRAGRPAVCADRAVPESVTEQARVLGAPLYRLGCAFDMVDSGHWRGWGGRAATWPAEAATGVLDDNLAAVLAVMALLDEMPDMATITQACRAQEALHGRREQVDGDVSIIYDVGHNVEAVTVLVAFLQEHPISGATHVVIGMLSDKPVEAAGAVLAQVADYFYAANLAALSPRGLDSHTLAARLGRNAAESNSPAAALGAAQTAARPGDRIVVCGSFFTVAHARRDPRMNRSGVP